MMMRVCDPLLSVRISLLLGLWRVLTGRSGRCRAGCRIYQGAVLECCAIASTTAASCCWKGSPSIVVLVVSTIRRCWVVRIMVLRVMGCWIWLLLLFVTVDRACEGGYPGLQFGFVGHARCL